MFSEVSKRAALRECREYQLLMGWNQPDKTEKVRDLEH